MRTVETLTVARAAAADRLLIQLLMPCPTCGTPGAAHLDRNDIGEPVLVRFVCRDACPVDAGLVLAALPATELTA